MTRKLSVVAATPTLHECWGVGRYGDEPVVYVCTGHALWRPCTHVRVAPAHEGDHWVDQGGAEYELRAGRWELCSCPRGNEVAAWPSEQALVVEIDLGD